MSEDTKKVEKSEQDAKVEKTEQDTKAAELSEQDLDKVAGGFEIKDFSFDARSGQ